MTHATQNSLATAAVLDVLITQGDNLGFEKSVLIGEAAYQLQGTPESTMDLTSAALANLITTGTVRDIGGLVITG